MSGQQPAEHAAPCPWCGGVLAAITVIEGSTFRWRAVQGCCAAGPEVRHDTLADDQVGAEADSRRRAIEAWNERAVPAEQPGNGLRSVGYRYRIMPPELRGCPWEGPGIVAVFQLPTPADDKAVQYQTLYVGASDEGAVR